MSNHRKGYLRDKAILEAIERHEILDAEQLHLLFFNTSQNGKRIAQRRLKKLVDKKRLNRSRESFDQPFYYYIGKKPGQATHKLGVNWVYIWFLLRLKSWEELSCFNYEQNYVVLRTDAFVGIFNTVTDKNNFYFIEFDNAASGNAFDKVTKYNKLYKSEKYLKAWWVKYADRFPAVIIVTTNQSRLNAIRKKIERENKNGLEFKVYLLDQIKGECENEDNRVLLPTSASR